MRIFGILFLLIWCSVASAQVRLSDKAFVSVITAAPGKHIWEKFGHSGIRVKDPESRIDVVFNYGMFTFGPDFAYTFAKGNLNYFVAAQSYRRFVSYYIGDNRRVTEQVLNLDEEQVAEVFGALMENTRPENKYYLYDYFRDNCATRVITILEQALGSDLHIPEDYTKESYTIRQLTDKYLDQNSWLDFGIDLGLGAAIDKEEPTIAYTYLPDYVLMALDRSTIQLPNGNAPLVKQKILINKGVPVNLPRGWFGSPASIFWGLLVLVGLHTYFIDYQKQKKAYYIDVPLFLFTGLAGCLLFFLWFMTDHKATAHNYNMLWAFPLDTIAAIFLLIPPLRKWLRFYFLAVSLVICLFLLGYILPFPQQLHHAVLPIALVLLIRAIGIWLKEKPKTSRG